MKTYLADIATIVEKGSTFLALSGIIGNGGNILHRNVQHNKTNHGAYEYAMISIPCCVVAS